MNYKSTLLGTLAYTLVTFPLAVVWHVVLFEEKYRAFGYFEGEPSFVLGLVTIIIQGGVLSFLYSYAVFSGNAIIRLGSDQANLLILKFKYQKYSRLEALKSPFYPQKDCDKSVKAGSLFLKHHFLTSKNTI